MNANVSMAGARFPIGVYRGVALEVAVWDAAGAEVDLSCACMFTHEVGPEPVGGLRHLDQVLDGALLSMRTEGVFRGEALETMLLSCVPAIPAKALMMVGLGEPDAFHAEVLGRAVRCAVSAANARCAESAGIAPGLLDSGLSAGVTQGASETMLLGAILAVDGAHRLAELGLASPPTLRRWSFGAGATHAQDVCGKAYLRPCSNGNQASIFLLPGNGNDVNSTGRAA